MVAELKTYFLKVKGSVSGPYTLSQLSRMWVSGNVTADAYYRLGEFDEWDPIVSLSETLEAICQVVKAPANAEPAAVTTILDSRPKLDNAIQRPAVIHPNLVEGDGSKDSPYVINALSSMSAARIEQEIVAILYGPEAYGPQTSRAWQESPRGKPGNGDLCRTVLSLKGQSILIWFDLYLVTKHWEDPEAVRQRNERLNSPAGIKAQQHLKELLAAGPMKVNDKSESATQPFQSPSTPSERLQLALSLLQSGNLLGAEGLAAPFLLTADDCRVILSQFRLKWIAIHLIFWMVVGFASGDARVVVGVVVSGGVFLYQVQWKCRQLLRAQGLSQEEVERRIKAQF